jgi:hypothetical protein
VKKGNIFVPNAVEKPRTGSLWSRDQMLSFFTQAKKKDNQYEIESTYNGPTWLPARTAQ